MARKNAQIPHTSTEIRPLTKISESIECLKEDAFMAFPSNDQWKERLCHSLLLWSNKSDSLFMQDFATEMGIRLDTIGYWTEQHPLIKAAWVEAKRRVGTRRQKGALFRKFDKDVVFRDIHNYNPEWREINAYNASLKKESEQLPTTINIIKQYPKVITPEELKEQTDEIHK